MSATTTNPLVRLYGHQLTPAARSMLIEGLMPGPAITSLSDHEVATYVRDQIAAEIAADFPALNVVAVYTMTDTVTDPSALLDPTADPRRRASCLAQARGAASTCDRSDEPAPF